MDSVNKTLYIPLYGKAYVSRKGLFLEDRTAEKIWEAEGFPLKGKSASKWLAYYMGIRAAVFDSWVRSEMSRDREAVVIHLGCGLDSRCLRAGESVHKWYDLDFPQVIGERRRYFSESEWYRMISADVRQDDWLAQIPENGSAIVVMEGLSMYLSEGELQALMANLSGHFARLAVRMDCYSVMAAQLSKYKNPIHAVGVTKVYGMDDPTVLEGSGVSFVQEHEMTPARYIDQLKGIEKRIFSKLYAGGFAKKLYRLYEYRKG